MLTRYRPFGPDQVMLLPAAPQDWLPAGHAPDANWLLPMIQAVGNNLGELPELGLADAG